MRYVFLAEVLQGGHDRAGRSVAQRAEGFSEDGVRDVEKFGEISFSTCSAFEPTQGDPVLRARDHCMVELLYGSGLRVGELVGLDVVASTPAGTMRAPAKIEATSS